MITSLMFAAALAAAPPSEPVAAPAPSTTVSAPAATPKKEPQSVWRPLEGDLFEHAQTGLRCPAAFAGFGRAALTTYDDFGLDVSCGYNGGRSVITMYLSLDASLDGAFTRSKASLMERWGPQGAQLIADGRADAGGLSWLRAQYTLPNRWRSDVWLADVNGWLLKFRMTYPEVEAPAVEAQVAALISQAQTTAGQHLRLCAKSAPPPRAGKVVKDAKRNQADTIMAMAVAGAGAAEAETPLSPIVFCFEEALVDKQRGFLSWRGVLPDGTDAKVDRLTVMTVEAPPELDTAVNAMSQVIAGATNTRPGRWVATLQDGRKTLVFGHYEGRPSAKTRLPLLHAIVDGKAQSLGGWNPDTKTIELTAPAK